MRLVDRVSVGAALLGAALGVVLTPPYFNIATKRRIEASSTCGEGVDDPELYCKLVGANQDAYSSENIVIQGQVCDECDPRRPDKAHPPQYAIDGSENFWMSPPLSRGSEYNQVNLTISLGQEFHVAYVLIKMGNSPRPGVWSLERSADNGETYRPWQYFADTQADCEMFFGKESVQPITKDDSVICETSYSKIVPLEGGEIVVSLLRNRPSAQDFFNSTILQEWTRATNIRLRLMRAKTLLGHLMSLARQDPTVTRRYFYSIKDISIGGRCRCNGHAFQCDIPDENDPFKLLCRCQHNTCGANCERCCDNKVQKPWRQSKANKLFVCEECNCHGHSEQCIYDEKVDELGLSIDIHGNYEGGGVCQNCRDNTEGINCQKCKAGFFRPHGRLLNDTDVCELCRCEGEFYTGNCAEGTGKCECDARYQGPDCDSCSYGHFGYPKCEKCKCFLNGTDGYYCEPESGGDCPCKPNYAGDYCDSCSEGFYNFPECLPCECNPIGSDHDVCDPTSGECECRSNFGDQKCDRCANGYYNFPQCTYCDCDPTGTEEEVCDVERGECLCREGFGGRRCDQCTPGYFGFPECRPCGCSDLGSTSKVCDTTGRCSCLLHFSGQTCHQCVPGYYDYPNCHSCDCDLYGSQGDSCDDEGQCICKHLFGGKRCEKCREGLFNFPLCEECNCHPAGVMENFPGCGNLSRPGELCQCKPRVQARMCDQCRPLYWNLQLPNPDGCEDCDCHLPGVTGELKVCDQKMGQCSCKPSVTSRRCDTCVDGMYNLHSDNLFGCSDCGCDIGGSVSDVCDKATGQCLCHPKITGRSCNEPILTYFFPTLHQMKYEAEDSESPQTDSPIRYGHSESTFPEFSSRGYAVFSQIQNHIMQRIFIQKSSLYRLILRYINPNDESVTGDIEIFPENESDEEQRFQVEFKPTDSAAFVEAFGFGSRIVTALIMNPGAWNLHIKVGKTLFLDYFVLMPAAYYEGNILIYDVKKPCTVGDKDLCRHFQYPDISHYPLSLGTDSYLDHLDDRRYYDDYRHLDTVGLSTTLPLLLKDVQPKINMQVEDLKSGRYVLVVSYLTMNQSGPGQVVRVAGRSAHGEELEGASFGLKTCRYTWLCRQVLVNDKGELAVYNLSNVAVFSLTNDHDTAVGIESLRAIPLEEWSLDLVQPKKACVKKEGKCIESTYLTPLEFKKVEIELGNEDLVGSVPSNVFNPSTGLIYLDEGSDVLEVRGKVPHPGDYVFVVHFYQPDYPNFNITLEVHNGEISESVLPVNHCPLNSGCRAVVAQADGNHRYRLHENFQLTFKAPDGRPKGVWLDYTLVVPADKYNTRLTSEEPVDQSGLFIKECGQNHFYMDNNTSEFCRKAAFSLTTAYNDGPIACHCEPLGSQSFECEQFGGQCRCKENIVGRQCEQCKQGYYGYPNCQPCSCPPTALCESETGECVCPPRVTGKECDKCEPYTFGYDRLSGCEPCNCHPLGVFNDLQCDLFNGSCTCKDNIVGRTCSRCEFGHYSFPICEHCDCDPRGTTNEICDQETSECKCKENVDGYACDVCREGTFNLQKSNRKGCTKCFCFGKTENCLSASLYRMEITGVDGWTLSDITVSKRIMVEPVSNNALNASKGVVQVDLTDNELLDKVVYFKAPERFLRNQLKAYGGNLTYAIYSDTSPFGSLVSSPDVILFGADTYLVVYSVELPARSQYFQNYVEMVETSFAHWPSSQPVTRDQLMVTLQNLEAVYIRATFWEGSLLTRLLHVSLDSATEEYDDRGLALSVEKCFCPANYAGLSCEDCAPGYYRVQAGPFGGFCVPCQCNNHASTCHPDTGVCHDCKHNTMGDHCEKCAIGHHGNATYGTPKDCLICACPIPQASNNFAYDCEVSEDGEEISCDCKPGYYGARCESCATGFYGEPEKIGETCKPCQCSGNINPEDVGACDSVTGKCVRCLNNTFGDSCQLCAPGFYGDAVDLKNCQSCVCDRCGTDRCDHASGTCQCKPNVQGEKCDRCALHHYGFNSCEGCRPCDCQLASDSSQCEPETGQCRCKAGVIGRTCDQCEPGYWNYTAEGCTLCSCNVNYSIGVGCNPETGQCKCLRNVTGERCDSCPPRWIFIPNEGCEECNSCVHSLLDSVAEIAEEFASVKDGFESTAISYFTNQRLKYINDTVNSLRPKVIELEKSHIDMGPITKEFEQIESNMNRLEKKANSLSKSELLEKVNRLSEDTDSLIIEVEEAVEFARQIVKDMINIANSFDQGGFGTPAAEFEQDLREAQLILGELEAMTLAFDADEIRDKYLNRSEDILRKMEKFKEPIEEHEALLEDLREAIQEMDATIADLDENIASTNKKTLEIEKLNRKNSVANIDESFKKFEATVAEANRLLNETDAVNSDTLTLLTDADRISQDLERSKLSLEEAKEELSMLIQNREEDFGENEKLVHVAQAKAEELMEQARELERVSQGSPYTENAIKAANAYKKIVEVMRDALITANDANVLAEGTLAQVISMQEDAEVLQVTSSRVHDEAEGLLMTTQNELGPRIEIDMAVVDQLAREMSETETNLVALDKRLQTFEESEKEVITPDKLIAIMELDTSSLMIQDEIRHIVEGLPSIKEDTDKFANDSIQIQNFVEQAYKSFEPLNKIKPDILDLIYKLRDKPEEFRADFDNIDQSLKDIRKKVEHARSIANGIRLATKFEKNAFLDLRKPEKLEMQSIRSDISLYMKTKEENGFVFFLGGPKLAKVLSRSKRSPAPSLGEYMMLEIENAYPKLTMDLGSGPTTISNEKKVNDGKWYKIEVTRTGKSVHLKVTWQGPGGSWDRVHSSSHRVAQGSSLILDLDRTSKLLVGGLPPTFPLAELQKHGLLNYPYFQGTVEELTVGGYPVGLWNTLNAENNLPDIERSELVNYVSTTGFSFGGDGYVELDSRPFRSDSRFFVSMVIKTVAKDGLIFLAANGSHFMSLEMREGRIICQFNMGSGELTLATYRPYNDGLSHQVVASRQMTAASLQVDGELAQTGTIPGTNHVLQLPSSLFFGGYSEDHGLDVVTLLNFDGCIDNVRIKDTSVDLNKNINAFGVLPGCPKKVSTTVSFEKGSKSYVRLSNLNATDNGKLELILRFKTKSSEGLLACIQDGGRMAVLMLRDGHLYFRVGDDEVKTTNSMYNNSAWHVIMAIHDSDRMEIVVNDTTEGISKVTSPPMKLVDEDVYFGGVPSSVSASLSIMTQFHGCISDAVLNEAVINFSEAVEQKEGSHLGKCTIESKVVHISRPLPSLPPPVATKKPTTTATTTTTAATTTTMTTTKPPQKPLFDGQCKLPLNPQFDNGFVPAQGYRFGTKVGSRLEYDKLPGLVRNKSDFSFDVKTHAADGILFYTEGHKNNDFIAIFMQNGTVHFGFDCASGPLYISSKMVVNDGKWHTIRFKRKNNQGTLYIDDVLQDRGTSSGNTEMIDVAPPYYLGGIPNKIFESAKSKLKDTPNNFFGCLRGFNGNGTLIDHKNVVDVVPCSDKQETGIFFPVNSGYVKHNDSFRVGRALTLKMEIKARKKTGLLLFLHGRKDYLSVELINGSVVLTVSQDEESSAVYEPTNTNMICDGNWHNITVIKQSKVLTIAVNDHFGEDPVIGKFKAFTTYTKSPMYIGGFGGGTERLSKQPWYDQISSKPHFVGCVRNVVFNQAPVRILSREIVGNALFGVCPTD